MTPPTDLAPQVEASLLPRPGHWARWWRTYSPAAIVFVVGLGVWEVGVGLARIEAFLLPPPSIILPILLAQWSVIFPAGLRTMLNAVAGFGVGSVLGMLVALGAARWASVRAGLLPVAAAVNAMPIVALAPIMNQWFGLTTVVTVPGWSFLSFSPAKAGVVALIVFFPVLINTVRGLAEVDQNALDLMHSYAASDLAILWQVRVPHALPYVFNALKVASTLSVIGAIVSEYFGGARDVLGIYISQQAALFHFAAAWAAVFVASGLGILFYALLLLGERLALPWHQTVRPPEGE